MPGTFGVPFVSAMVSPYKGVADEYELGDPNLQNHTSIDPSLATAWKKNPPPRQLREFTRQVAQELGFDVD